MSTIALVSIGPVPGELVSWLVGRLHEVIGQDIVVGEPIPLPATGYDSRRRQYQAQAVIGELRTLSYPGSDRVVGLIDADCYAPGLNFVFGQAALGGREAFVALSRLRPAFYGQPEDVALFHERVLKEVLHELGHTWGLGHCVNPHCVMYFSNTLEDTDRKGLDYCLECEEARVSVRQPAH